MVGDQITIKVGGGAIYYVDRTTEVVVEQKAALGNIIQIVPVIDVVEGAGLASVPVVFDLPTLGAHQLDVEVAVILFGGTVGAIAVDVVELKQRIGPLDQ